jgi:type III secretion system low calcium response chaperone LcrH/SycD
MAPTGETSGVLTNTREARVQTHVQRWADGKATLKEVRGYSDEELYSIARTAHIFFYQGKVDQARVLFQGLYAVNPLNTYFAKALGVVEQAAGNEQGALAAFDVALKLSPNDAAAYVGRAEVRLALGQRSGAADDLRSAARLLDSDAPLSRKVSALLSSLEKGLATDSRKVR